MERPLKAANPPGPKVSRSMYFTRLAIRSPLR